MDCRMTYRSFWIPELQGLNPFTEMSLDVQESKNRHSQSVYRSLSNNPAVVITVDHPNTNNTFERLDLILGDFFLGVAPDVVAIYPNNISIEIDGVLVFDSNFSNK